MAPAAFAQKANQANDKNWEVKEMPFPVAYMEGSNTVVAPKLDAQGRKASHKWVTGDSLPSIFVVSSPWAR
jgi:hypothetical protein